MGKIVSRQHAQALIRAGKAREDALVRPDPSSDIRYVAITRLDVQRIDHYQASAADIARLA